MATRPTKPMHRTHATSGSGSGWSTRRIAVTALFCAVAAICTLVLQFPIIPGVTWLQYDPSGVVALLAGFFFGPATGVAVSIIPYFVHFATAGGVYGVIMASLATLSLVLPAALVYQRRRSMRGALVGLVLGGVTCLVVCILANLVVTPLYTGMSVDQVMALVLPALLPFNVVKIVVNCVLAALVMRPLAKALGIDGPREP